MYNNTNNHQSEGVEGKKIRRDTDNAKKIKTEISIVDPKLN